MNGTAEPDCSPHPMAIYALYPYPGDTMRLRVDIRTTVLFFILISVLSAVGCARDSDTTAESSTPTPTPMRTLTSALEPPTPTPTRTPIPRIEPPTPTPSPTTAPIIALNDPSTPCYPWREPYGYQDTFLQWSPDGSRILFNIGPHIHAVDAEGSRIQMIADTSGEISFDGTAHDRFGTMTYFDVSPDGSKLVYSTCRYPYPPGDIDYQYAEDRPGYVLDPVTSDSGYTSYRYVPYSYAEIRRYSFEIAVSNIDGTESRRLTENEAFDSDPVWSPDGTRIAFISDRSGKKYSSDPDKLYTMASDGSDVRMLFSKSAGSPAWSPDGRLIAFIGEGAVHTVRPDGSGLTRISESRSDPAWSPDGRRLALVALDGYGAALYTVVSDGSDPVRLTRIIDDASQKVLVPDTRNLMYESFWVRSVSWSPDGSEILVGPYLVNLESPETLRLLEFEGGTRGRALDLQHVLTSWSPDGSAIAVRVEDAQPYIIDLDDSDFRVLVVSDIFLPAAVSAGGTVAARIASCSGGYVIAEPDSNPGLVSDCEALMGLMDSLAGKAFLNWSPDTRIEQWNRVTVGGSPPRVTALRLGSPFVGTLGSILPELSGLTNLEELILEGAEFTGSIPAELGSLTNLKTLIIHRTWLTGNIPAELGSLANLEVLNLDQNQLTGSIPGELGNLASLKVLDLGRNELTGSIPGDLGNLASLEVLDLGENLLVGSIPVELGDLAKLKELNLVRNLLVGSIPVELGNLPNLRSLGVSGNRLEGCMTLANGTEVCS